MSESSVYFETLTVWHFLIGWCRHAAVRRALGGRSVSIYYVDVSRVGRKVLLPFLRWAGTEVSRLDFEMRDIKDEGGELIRIRITRQDLFDLKEAIVASDTYRTLARGDWQTDRIRDYVNKGLVDESIWDENSPARALFLIEVVRQHVGGTKAPRNLFIMRARLWFDYYRESASRHGIDVVGIGASPLDWLNTSTFREALYRFPRLYVLVRTYKEQGTVVRAKLGRKATPKLYIDGRGDVNLKNDGHHSDFFWHLNSAFPAGNIIYRHHSEKEAEVLTEHGVNLLDGHVSLGSASSAVERNPHYFRTKLRREHRRMKALLASYRSTRAYWCSVFRAHNVKVWLTWHKYDKYHIAATDAIEDNAGISVCWPIAFDGYRNIECMSNTHVLFSDSRFSADIARQCGSVWDYNVVIGYARDYASPLLRREAQELRRKLESCGAKRIVLVLDENSLYDARWHTGHALQRENYSAILHKLMETPWMGVVFKPKAANTLRQRLGPVAELLAAAEQTGRCFVYETSGRYTTSAPPLLAGLSADVCIHGHLGGGTAALECALEGLPTLLIDREGAPKSKLYDLPAGKVVFKSWPDAIDALMRHFSSPNGLPGFGDWSSILDKLDPFRDGKAAQRMGTYLQWLIEGYQEGKTREVILAEAAERYRDQWGADKVLSA